MSDRTEHQGVEGAGELAHELRALPEHDTSAEAAERLRRAAVEAFVETHELKGHRWQALATRGIRALPPIVVVGTVGVYLSWAVSTANALFGP